MRIADFHKIHIRIHFSEEILVCNGSSLVIPNIDLGRLILKAAVSGGDNVVNRQSHMVYFLY